MKGIYQQIREDQPEEVKLPTNKEFRQFCDKLSKSIIIQRQKAEKSRKENLSHLNKRAKELNEEIPFELLLLVQTAPNGVPMIGTEFLNKYKKWLQ